MEGLKALGYMLLVGGFLFLLYELYLISYEGLNPFQ